MDSVYFSKNRIVFAESGFSVYDIMDAIEIVTPVSSHEFSESGASAAVLRYAAG